MGGDLTACASAAASALHRMTSKNSDLAREAVGLNPLLGRSQASRVYNLFILRL